MSFDWEQIRKFGISPAAQFDQLITPNTEQSEICDLGIGKKFI